MYFTVDFPSIYYMPPPPKKVGDEGQDRVNSKFYMYVLIQMPSSNATCLQATYFIIFVIEFTVMKTFHLEAVFRKAVVFAK